MNAQKSCSGTVIVSAATINKLVIEALGFPTGWFVTLGKAKLNNQTGDLECGFNASTVETPSAPNAAPPGV